MFQLRSGCTVLQSRSISLWGQKETKEKPWFEPSNSVVLHLSRRCWRILTIAYLNAAILVRSPGKNSIEESLKLTELSRGFPCHDKMNGRSINISTLFDRNVAIHSTFIGAEIAVFSLHAKLVQMQLTWTSSRPSRTGAGEAAWGYVHYNEISICFNGFFISISSHFYSN